MQAKQPTPPAPERIRLTEVETLRIQASAAQVETMMARYQGAQATVAHLALALPKAQDEHNKLAESIIEDAKARASVDLGTLPAPIGNLGQPGAPLNREQRRRKSRASLAIAGNGSTAVALSATALPGADTQPPELPPAA